MPICTCCQVDKPIGEFAFRSIALGTHQGVCRACHAIARKAHYERTKPVYIENERLRVRRHRERNRGLLVAYLREHPCVDCGETDPVVLDFDHRDPSMKSMEVTKLAARKPWPAVMREIAKCDVRCASCHRKRTAEQFGWRRALWTPSTDGTGLVDAIASAERDHRPTSVAMITISEARPCRTCGVLQPITEFAVKDVRTGRRSTKCKTCQRAYAKAHYQRNRDSYLQKAGRRNRSERDRIAAMLLDYLRDHPCVDCGSTDLRTLEFDHRDGEKKSATINALIRGSDWDGLLIEIPKCDVRCANCHRKRTARQFGWHRLRLGESAA